MIGWSPQQGSEECGGREGMMGECQGIKQLCVAHLQHAESSGVNQNYITASLPVSVKLLWKLWKQLFVVLKGVWGGWGDLVFFVAC